MGGAAAPEEVAQHIFEAPDVCAMPESLKAGLWAGAPGEFGVEARLQRELAELVVERAASGVAEDLIGTAHLLEALFCPGVVGVEVYKMGQDKSLVF